jgi:hypothetical protein
VIEVELAGEPAPGAARGRAASSASRAGCRYESYVDLVPGEWTRVRIEARGDRARLYVHGQEQPALIVNDVKTGATGRGAVALWIEPGTVAHFRNLTVRAEPESR